MKKIFSRIKREIIKYALRLYWLLCSCFTPRHKRPKAVQSVFTRVYKSNLWGDSESVSGEGSTVDVTKHIIGEIERILIKYDIESVLDIPCGDFNWMQAVNFGSTRYIGADIVEDLILENRNKYPDCDFHVLDIVNSNLPEADMIIVRDCFVHLPYNMITQALSNIRSSGAKFLLTTTFTDHDNHDIMPGDWRPINLQREPIAVESEVLELINEGFGGRNAQYKDKALILFRL